MPTDSLAPHDTNRWAQRSARPAPGSPQGEPTVDGWEILHHLRWMVETCWNPINHGMFTTYQLVIRISQPSTAIREKWGVWWHYELITSNENSEMNQNDMWGLGRGYQRPLRKKPVILNEVPMCCSPLHIFPLPIPPFSREVVITVYQQKRVLELPTLGNLLTPVKATTSPADWFHWNPTSLVIFWGAVDSKQKCGACLYWPIGTNNVRKKSKV